MNTNIRKLSVGIQDFEDLRTTDCIYVDKTPYVYKLITQGKPYFLSRPRRFGKSLFLSTLKAYFQGKKELFEGLAIAELEKDWTQYPVIYIDFNDVACVDAASLEAALDFILKRYEIEWSIEKISDLLSARFSTLIAEARKKFGQKVAVLVDEYDKPLINTLDNPQINEDMRNILKGFYGVLKSADANLRFVFLTGVTKFSKVSIFSDLNQLQDISMDEDFAGICGITQTELEENFMPEITALAEKNVQTYKAALEELRKRYDGYHFAKVSEDMYNPFSVLNTLSKRDFAFYWFTTGTPTFLAKALRAQDFDIRKLENDIEIPAISIMDYRTENEDMVPLLYQTGYLTVKSYDRDIDMYVLGFPNEEVKYGFMNELLPAFVLKPVTSGNFSAQKFLSQLKKNDIDGFMKSLQSFFAAIPYDAIKREHRDEQYYQHVFYLLFTLMGQFAQTEVKCCRTCRRGRQNRRQHLCLRVQDGQKRHRRTGIEADRRQRLSYAVDRRRLVKIGVEFSQDEHGVKRWLLS